MELQTALADKIEKLEVSMNESAAKTEQLNDSSSKIEHLQTELENIKSVYERIALSFHESQKRNEELLLENAKFRESEIASTALVARLESDISSLK